MKSRCCAQKARGFVNGVVTKQQNVTRSHNAGQPRSQGRGTLETRLHVDTIKFIPRVHERLRYFSTGYFRSGALYI